MFNCWCEWGFRLLAVMKKHSKISAYLANNTDLRSH